MTDRLLKLAGLPAEKHPAKATRRTLTEGKTADVWVSVISLGDDPTSPEVFLGTTEQAVWRMLAEHAANDDGADDDDPEVVAAGAKLLEQGQDAVIAALSEAGYDNFMHPHQQGVWN